MKANIGTSDRVFRLLLGVVIVLFGVITESWWGLIGLLPIMTAVTSFCGLYTLLGISTCKVKASQKS
jgi:predicted RND superfamily exporter protein